MKIHASSVRWWPNILALGTPFQLHYYKITDFNYSLFPDSLINKGLFSGVLYVIKFLTMEQNARHMQCQC